MADAQRAGADLEKMTDYVEERELDSAKLARAMDTINSANEDAAAAVLAAREKELALVQVDAEDIKLVASELELEPAAAERALRENKGDVVTTLKVLVH